MEQNIDVLEDILETVNDIANNAEDGTEYTQNIEVLKAILETVESISKKTLTQYVKTASVSTDRNVELDMEGYTFDSDDIINVFIDGAIGVEGTEWSLDTTTEGHEAVVIAGATSVNVVITVLKMEVI